MKLIVLCLLATLGVSFAAPSINQLEANGTFIYHPPLGGRIVGGVATTIYQHPWQVALLRNGGQICGGMLLAPRIVLTAAHCVVPSVIPQVSMLNIRSGSTTHNTGGLRVAVSHIVTHELYEDCSTCSLDYDIAILHLTANAIGAGVPAGPVELWNANTIFQPGTIGTVTGWGATFEGGFGSATLREVDVPIVAAANCRAVYGSIISARTICAGVATGGRDSCQGDSGGPFVVQNRLAGIVSFGYGCARPGYPGVYASVPGYRAWIQSHAGL